MVGVFKIHRNKAYKIDAEKSGFEVAFSRITSMLDKFLSVFFRFHLVPCGHIKFIPRIIVRGVNSKVCLQWFSATRKPVETGLTSITPLLRNFPCDVPTWRHRSL